MSEVTPREGVIERIVDLLEEGQSLSAICDAHADLPNRRTINRWKRDDPELAARLMDARETGFEVRAERAVERARNATDANLARLEFDAERWYLGKLSRAFAEKPIAIDVRAVVANDDAFANIAAVLDRAAATIAGSGTSTSLVAGPGPPGPTDP